MEKTAQFVSDMTDGHFPHPLGWSAACAGSFPLKSKEEQGILFRSLPDAPVMHVDGTVARGNGINHNVVVCSNGRATMYFARENKGHAGIMGTPVETSGERPKPQKNKIFFQ